MQKKSSFIFSFNKKYKIYMLFFITFYLAFIMSFLIFCIKPSLFYYRAWEYFDDIVYRIPSNKKWKDFEYGDVSRKYLVHFQNKRKTIVSCNEDGFRSSGFNCDNYPITIFGDSHVWGSGLSDNETIPWIVSKELNIPVFNAGRSPFRVFKDISHPKISKSKIIVEIMAEHLLVKESYVSQEAKINTYNKRIQDLNFFNIFSISPKRYFIFLKLIKWFSPSFILNEMKSDYYDNYWTPKDQLFSLFIPEEHFMKVLNEIKERSQVLKKMGYIYIFALTPNRELLLAHKKDDKDILREQRIVDYFKKENVHYIDMCSIFRKRDPHDLYQINDSHISPKGAKLMAEALKEYILSLDKKSEISFK